MRQVGPCGAGPTPGVLAVPVSPALCIPMSPALCVPSPLCPQLSVSPALRVPMSPALRVPSSPSPRSLFGGSDYKLIYRHYATLYFVFCVDSSESELGILDLIQVRPCRAQLPGHSPARHHSGALCPWHPCASPREWWEGAPELLSLKENIF